MTSSSLKGWRLWKCTFYPFCLVLLYVGVIRYFNFYLYHRITLDKMVVKRSWIYVLRPLSDEFVVQSWLKAIPQTSAYHGYRVCTLVLCDATQSMFVVLRSRPSQFQSISITSALIQSSSIQSFQPYPKTYRLRTGCQCNSSCVPWQSRMWHLGDDFGRFLANSGRFCGRGATLWCKNPLLSTNNFT